ncbi:M20 family metallo-hydrolase [Tropicimonas marinistellae]|uniref:M20 family metallo-hydrolase n=1 Tax=Tropicimonas marinistellae TaxID=1739787 RepID=UPI0013730BD2|nr:M20 family metallo-hydrolase [Tropicimonas marinistellae]
MADLEALSRFGRRATDHGIDRPAYSPSYRAALDWLRSRMEEAGLTVRMDAAGNLIGRLGRSSGPAVVCGSHIDTVPGGGALDGALGVVAGLEVARQLTDLVPGLTRAYEVVAFADEEGAYLSEIGVRAMVGDVSPDEVRSACGPDGPLADVLSRFGLNAADLSLAARPPSDFAAYLELHIEQGPVLQTLGKRIGIVTEIVGLLTGDLTFFGEANHAGTTPLPMRKDAFRAAAETVSAAFAAVETEFPAETRLTFGNIQLAPGAANVVPATAKLTYEIRAGDEALIDALHSRVLALAGRAAQRCRVEVADRTLARDAAAPMAPEMIATLESVASARGVETVRMPSGAGHDAQVMAGVCPTGMIFVPSIDGVSHNPSERTDVDDILLGASLLCHAVFDVLGCR